MKSKEFNYEVPRLPKNSLPNIFKPDGSLLTFFIDGLCNLTIKGDKEGLLFLAKWLITMALTENDEGLHTHLFVEDGEIDDLGYKDTFKEVVIYNSDFLKYRNDN